MYNLSAFTNDNVANFHFTVNENIEHSFEDLLELEAVFAAKVQHDNVNDDADVVLVYERDGKAVAWYDMELLRGYIAP